MLSLAKYPFNVLDIELPNQKVKIVGVQHTRKEFKKFKEFYTDLIDNSSCVLSERNPTEWSAFYSGVNALCKDREKSMFHADPRHSFLMDAIDSSLIGLGGPVITYAFMFPQFLPFAIPLKIYFLNKAGLFNSAIKKLSKKDSTSFIRYDFGAFDYSNIQVAKGIERAAEHIGSNDRGEYMLVIYGDDHIKPIQFYLENLEPREKKNRLYDRTLGFIGDEKLRKYRFADNRWRLVLSEKI